MGLSRIAPYRYTVGLSDNKMVVSLLIGEEGSGAGLGDLNSVQLHNLPVSRLWRKVSEKCHYWTDMSSNKWIIRQSYCCSMLLLAVRFFVPCPTLYVSPCGATTPEDTVTSWQ